MNADVNADADAGEAVTKRPDNTDLRFAIGRIKVAIGRGDLDAAWKVLDTATADLDPDDLFRENLANAMRRDVGVATLKDLAERGDHDAVVDVATDVIARTTGEAGDEVYQRLNDALVAQGVDVAERHHGLRHVSGSLEQVPDGELVCCLVVKNGMWRLDEYLESLRAQGAGRIFAIDNESSDGTLDHLTSQDEITVWRTGDQFSHANCGSAWFDVLLRRHAPNAWTLILDLDEEIRVAGDPPLPEFCRELDRRGLKAATGHHVDLYPRSATDPTLHLDRHPTVPQTGLQPFDGQTAVATGLRERVFGASSLANKAPLQRFEPGLRLCNGQHFTHHRPEYISSMTCVVLHHKFRAGFGERVASVGHDESYHATWRTANARYAALAEQIDGAMYDPDVSVPLGTTDDLVEHGIVRPLPPRDETT